MKKFLLSILTFLYLGVSSGVAMEIHYCMGKKAGVDLYAVAEKEKCGKCGMKDKKGGCCNDEHKFYKLSTDAQKQLSTTYHYDVSLIAIVANYSLYNIYEPVAGASVIYHNNSPPDYSGTDIYIRHCNFRL